jgi:hypothetical protein
MSHILNYDGHYFRVEVGEVADAQLPDKKEYVAWCSDASKELRDLPRQALSRFVAGPPLATHAEALRHAQDWIKTNWDALRTQRSKQTRQTDQPVGFIYTVWLFKGESNSTGYDFKEFSDARAFAKTAETSFEITKVGITDPESPQYLTVWEKGT